MNLKIILPIVLVLIVGTAIFVSASMIVTNEGDNKKAYNVEIPVIKGWNLVASGFTFASDLRYLDETGDIKYDNIKAVYVYSNKIIEYISNYPEYDQRLYSANDYFNGDEQDIIGQANWIYVDKSGTLKYQTKAIKTIDSTNLFAGWNFVSITPEMIDKSLDNIKGSCDIEKAYFWNYVDKKWEEFPLVEDFEESEALGYGLIIKVTNNCKLGLGSSGAGGIPQLPE